MLATTRILLALSLFIGLAATSKAAEHTKDSLDKVRKNLKAQKALLIDVREQREWDAGHLREAKLVPLSKIRQGIDEKDLAKDKIIYCHCRSGGRVLLATDILKKQGYDIRPLKHGYGDLLKAGFERAKQADK